MAGATGRVADWVDLVRRTKPIVAAVNGAAIGVGLTMVLPFDRIVVGEGAKLSMRFIKMGVVPELASTSLLPQRCGFGAASDLVLSGRTILGPEAAALGVADECVADDSVLDVALERARSYAENPTPQLRWIKQLLTQNAAERPAGGAAPRARADPGGEHDARAPRGGGGLHGEAPTGVPPDELGRDDQRHALPAADRGGRGEPHAVVVDVPLGEAVEQLVEGDPALEAGEAGAQAEVQAEAEGQVLDVVAVDVEHVGVRVARGSRLADATISRTALPAGIVAPWYSTSCMV